MGFFFFFFNDTATTEIYTLSLHDALPICPKVAKAFDEDGWVLHCDSFTKTLSPGNRVGWVAPGRFKAKVEFLKFVNTAATPTLPQMAIAQFLQNGGYDHHLSKIRRFYAAQMQRMTEAV